MQYILSKLTKRQNSNTYLLKTIVITSFTTIVGAFSFLQIGEHPRSELKPHQVTPHEWKWSFSRDDPLTIGTYPIPNQISRSLVTRIVGNGTRNVVLCAAANSQTSTDALDTKTVTNQSTENQSGLNGEKDMKSHGDEDASMYYYEKMKDLPRNLVDGHAIFGALLKPGFIERYETYRRVPLQRDGSPFRKITMDYTNNKEVCVADVRIGENLNGHSGIVHGGIISLLLDDTLGWGYEALRLSQNEISHNDDYNLVVTANLTVNYRAPLLAGSNVVIRVFHEKTDGRKVYFTARMESYDGKTLYSEASSLFIRVKENHLSMPSKEKE